MPKTRGTGILGSPTEPPVTNMQTVTKPSRLKLLLYGAPGVGKTWLAGSCPKPLVFDFDGGAASLAGRDVDVVDQPNTEEFQGQVAWLIEQQGAGYQTIILDTLTAAQKLTTVELMGSSDRMSQQLWGDTLSIWRKLLISLESLPCNLVVICHEKEENVGGDEDHAVKAYTYAVQGSIASDLHAMFDSIGRMTKHLVRTGSDGKPLAQPRLVRRVAFFSSREDFKCKDRLALFGEKPLKADLELLTRLAGADQPPAPKEETPAPAPSPAPPPPPPPPAPAAEPPTQAAPSPPRRKKKAPPKPPEQPELPTSAPAPAAQEPPMPPLPAGDAEPPPEEWEDFIAGGDD